MGKSFYFVVLSRDTGDDSVAALECVGAVVRRGIGTATDPDAAWVVIGTRARIASFKRRLDKTPLGPLVRDVRAVVHPDEGRTMARQLDIFGQ